MDDNCRQCGKWPTDKPVLVDGGILCVDCASNQLRWRDAYGESPTGEGIYLVINNDFDGGTSIHAKKKRGEKPAKPGDEAYPDAKNWKKVTEESEKKAAPAWQTSEGKSESGGLNDKGRASLKAQGHDIKRPQPEGGPRKDSFCARMKGMKSKLTSEETARDPDSRINKALRKWKCGSAAEKLAFLLKEAKCWEGYERVPGTKAMTPGSCRPISKKAPNTTDTKKPEVKKAASDSKKKDKEPERKGWTRPLVIGGGLLGSALVGAAAMAGRRIASPGMGGHMSRKAIIEGVKHLVNESTKQDTSNQPYSKLGY